MAQQVTGKVTLSSEPREKVIPSNEERKQWPVLVRVVAPAKTERAPIDLVAVLDVSGSMNTKTTTSRNKFRTRLDLVKAAMQLVSNKLGAGDRLAIVPFNGRVVGATRLIEMTPEGRTNVFSKVMQLKAGGDTKFLPALKHASELLENRQALEKQCRQGFIFLLSDGQDNTVLNDKTDMLAGVRYPTHTFGMCQNGYNPKSLVYIASKTKGTYHSVSDDASNVAHALGVFLAGITSVVAINTRINLHVPENSGGVLISGINSGAYDNTIEKDKRSGSIDVGVMCASEEKKFIVYLDVEKQQNAEAMTKQPLLTVDGEYTTASVGRAQMDVSKIEVERPATDDGEGSTTAGDHGGHTTWTEVVMVEIVRIKVVSIVEEVLQKHEHVGEPDQQQMAKELMAKWDNFIKETAAGKDAAECLKEKLPKHHVEEVHASLTKDEYDGVLYLYSWLASHQTQQATTVASTTAVAGWFHQQYMLQMAADAVFDACAIRPSVEVETDDSTGCHCVVDLERFDRRLELWSNLKHEARLMFQMSENAESHHVTNIFREASLDAINRAMHHDMYLAVVHASNLKRCYSGAGKQQLPHAHEAPPPHAVEKHSE